MGGTNGRNPMGEQTPMGGQWEGEKTPMGKNWFSSTNGTGVPE